MEHPIEEKKKEKVYVKEDGTEIVATNFIEEIIIEDLKNNKNNGRVHTRFPPEPNGFLHIGHAKAICIDFGIAEKFGGKCNLRFDDTNPLKEEQEFVDAIQEDVKWLKFDWEDRLYYASDYFDQMYEYAIELIKQGKAYVDDLSAEEIKEYRGTLTEPGKESPYRNRSIEENLDLFERMKNGEFPDGSKVLRAKIDMNSPNINMRDPVMYRILHAEHHRQGKKWCIYPMYDWAHGIEDSIEGITHSLCDIDFEDHRPLYDWFLEQLNVHRPQQIEFARLNVTYTVTSKRKLRELVEKGKVSGWDDPRMPTISGMRRRGYTPEAIRAFCEKIGVAKSNSIVDISLLEHCVREDLNKRAKRVMAVLDPLKVIITNYPEDLVEYLDAENNPEDENAGTRKVPFCREIFIEKEDFCENPPKNYFRLAPGLEIRLKHAYYIKCTDVIKDETTGEVIEIHCTYDPETKGGWSQDGRKVKGTAHWVSARHAIKGEARLYDYLFKTPNPNDIEEGKEFIDNFNENSLIVLDNILLEPSLEKAECGEYYQFLRKGYFCLDIDSKKNNKLIFNRIVSLKDSWSKNQKN